MLFTRLGTLLASLTAVLAVIRISIGIYIMSQPVTVAMKDMAVRYLGTTNVGMVLDQSAIVLGIAITIGILAEISRGLRREK